MSPPLFKQSPRMNWRRWIGDAGAALLLIMAAGVLCGWGMDIDRLRRPVEGTVAMNPLTAILFGISGLTAMILGHAQDSPTWRRVSLGLTWGVGIVGALMLADLLAGIHLGLDEILFKKELLAQSLFAGNRMAPNTALNFLLSGVGLAFAHYRRELWQECRWLVAGLVCLLSVAALIGYVGAVAGLYGLSTFIPMAVHTAAGFLVLAVVVALAGEQPQPDTTELDLAQHASAARKALEFKVKLGFSVALFALAVMGIVSYVAIAEYSTAGGVPDSGHAAAQMIGGRRIAGIISSGIVLAFVIVAAAGMVVRRNLFRRREAQVHLDNFFTLSLDLICLANTSGHFTHINPAWTKVLGHTDQELLGKPYLDFVHPDDRRSTVSEAEKVARGGDVHSFENRYRCKDGSYRWLTWNSILGPDGRTIYAMARDITERKETEERCRRAMMQAEEANESKSRFLANMSHEIRTPMAAIIGYADLLLDLGLSPSDRLDYVNTIRRNGEHLLTVINDVLDLSKIEAGKFQTQRIECCPCQILSDVASLMRVRAVEKLIRLEVKNEGLIPAKVKTDPARLHQVLINLVGNAIKFTEEGWVKLIMRLEEPSNGRQMLRFDIMDTGIGMSKPQMERLFQPFEQVDGSMTRRIGGTGLGLTISKRLAEMLGGRIEVDSSPGRGSTFTLLIDPGELSGVPRLKNCREALAGSPNLPREKANISLRGRVLLVDDGHDNRRLLSVYLREAGAEVATAENGRAGSDAALAAEANGEPFDVVLMDMQMPELDGYAAAALLRSRGYKRPVVALTAHAMAEDRDKCINAGCTDYLSKPVKREDLLAMVAKYSRMGEKGQSAEEESALGPQAQPDPKVQAGGTLHSTLADDTLKPYLLEYVAELPTRVAELDTCLKEGAIEQLKSKIHNIRGTGGLYGFSPITQAAADAEELMQANGSTEAINQQVRQLIEIIQSVEGFREALERTGRAQTR